MARKQLATDLLFLLTANVLVLTGTGQAGQHFVIDTTNAPTISSIRVTSGTGGGTGRAGILDGPVPVEPISLSIVSIDKGATSRPDLWSFIAEVRNTSTRTFLIPTRTGEDQAIDSCGSEIVHEASLQFDVVVPPHASYELRSSGRLFGCNGWKDSLFLLSPGEAVTIKGTISAPSGGHVTALRARWDMSELRYTPNAEGFRLDSVGKMFIQSDTIKVP